MYLVFLTILVKIINILKPFFKLDLLRIIIKKIEMSFKYMPIRDLTVRSTTVSLVADKNDERYIKRYNELDKNFID